MLLQAHKSALASAQSVLLCNSLADVSLTASFSPSSLTMGQLYEKEKDEDGFLYVAYSGENTFGV